MGNHWGSPTLCQGFKNFGPQTAKMRLSYLPALFNAANLLCCQQFIANWSISANQPNFAEGLFGLRKCCNFLGIHTKNFVTNASEFLAALTQYDVVCVLKSRKDFHSAMASCRAALTLSPHKAKKPASPTVANSRKAEIPACRSLIYSRKAELSAWKFKKKTRLRIMLCLGAPGLGTPMLWELRGERVKTQKL